MCVPFEILNRIHFGIGERKRNETVLNRMEIKLRPSYLHVQTEIEREIESEDGNIK